MIRYLVVQIDDERPLGPQLRAALDVLPWKVVWRLIGERYSLRHLRRMLDMSDISDRQTVCFGSMFATNHRRIPGEGHVMAAIFSPPSSPAPVYIQAAQAPTAPTQNDAAQQEAKRAELAAQAKQVGRSATILTDYALATQQPNTLKATLGA